MGGGSKDEWQGKENGLIIATFAPQISAVETS